VKCLFIVWLRCAGLTIVIPVILLLIPLFALCDRTRQRRWSYWQFVRQYYSEIAKLEVHISNS